MATTEQYQLLATHLGGISISDYLQQCYDVAELLVTNEIATATVPPPVTERAIVEVASELYHRRNAPNGIANWGDLDSGTAIRVARDAMVAARPLLAPWIGPVFA